MGYFEILRAEGVTRAVPMYTMPACRSDPPAIRPRQKDLIDLFIDPKARRGVTAITLRVRPAPTATCVAFVR